MKIYTLAATALLLASCGNSNQTKNYSAKEIAENSKQVNAFLDRRFDESVARFPEFASSLGLKTGYGEWNDRSDATSKRELDIMKATLDSLKKFDWNALDAQTKVSVRMYEEDVKRAEEGFKWRFHGYWISQMGGEHTDLPAFLINVHKVENRADAEAYLSRLSKMGKVFDQVLEQLKEREKRHIIPPHFTFSYVTNDLKTFIAGCSKAGAENVLLNDFTEKVNKLEVPQATKDSMIGLARAEIASTVSNAYQRLLDYWQTLDQKYPESHGVWALPEGDAYYQYCLKTTTTTDKTADEIFETGQKEVARIHREMQAIMKQVNFKNDSLQDFFQFMRTDKQFAYPNSDAGRKELLAESERYLDVIQKDYLSKLFNHRPKAPLKVMAVEKFREKSVGGAFYENPSDDGSRPGRFYVNLYNMADEPRYQMEALCYHEGIPGHHMQIALAQELQGIPKFRTHGGNTAYIEGWGLYSELVPKEVGLYKDPYSDFGRLSMEIFRAARLVVDVGIHKKHWTREQAIDYFLKNTANSKGDCEKEIERYFIWPGQATGYKIGMLKILELREKAKREMGDRFDIRGFHDVVLMNGAVPLNILEELVDEWIAESKSSAKK
ncbi:MAG: DUF885 domain-containing protein [Chitinophagales bacterium]